MSMGVRHDAVRARRSGGSGVRRRTAQPAVRALVGPSRREFLRLASLLVAGLTAGCGDGEAPVPVPEDASEPGPCVPAPDAAWLVPSDPRVELPHLGGAPDTPQGWTIAAFVDTVVPGAHRDPTGAPGGIDVGAAALFYDPELPAAEFVPLLATFLDVNAANIASEEIFGTLTAAQREQALDAALDLELMDFAVQMAKLAYYSSPAAGCHLGYPGPNPGYVDDPDFSFGVPLATEITDDGNYS